MSMGGYLKLFRKIENWEWIDNKDITYVFIRLLIKANYKEKIWHGITIKKGQFLTTRRNLAKEMNLSEQRLKTVLKKLESTHEIEITSTQRNTLITIVNYELYQSKEEKSTQNQPNINPISTQQATQQATQNETSKDIANKGIEDIKEEKATQQTTQEQLNNLSESNPNIRNNNNIILNYTKLNLLFNYLIYKEENFEFLTETDRENIVEILKRLELYTTKINYIPEDKVFELKLQYWSIMELYLSPYKIYLNSLKRRDFIFRFLKAKQYVSYNSEENLPKFIGYFIQCLRKEIKENGN